MPWSVVSREHIARAQRATGAALVAHRHPLAAAAADHQPGQQGRAVAHRTHALRACPVGVHPLQVPLVLGEADVGRKPARQPDQPIRTRLSHPAGGGPTRLASPRVASAATIGVDPSVGRVAQHVLHRGAAGPPPLQLPPIGSLPQPHPQLDPVIGQKAQHRIDRAELVEQVEDQPHHGLDLLVGVQHDLGQTGGVHTDRQRHGQRPTAGLGHPPRPHPLLEQMQLCFADRSFQPQQQPVVVLGRVVDPIRVGQQRSRQRTQLQQLVPLSPAAGQPGHLDPEHDPHVVQPDLERPAAGSPADRRPPTPNGPGPGSITNTRDGAQPNATARCVNPYCNRVDS